MITNHDLAKPTRMHIRPRTQKHIHLRPEILPHPQQPPMPRRPIHNVMKREIRLRCLTRTHPRRQPRKPINHPLHPAEILLVAMTRRPRTRHRLNRQPQAVHLFQIRPRQLRHHRTPIRPPHRKTLTLQLRQRIANRPPTHPQRIRQLLLPQTITRREIPTQDRITQPINHLLRQQRRQRRTQHRHRTTRRPRHPQPTTLRRRTPHRPIGKQHSPHIPCPATAPPAARRSIGYC
jgi:hypothetical protein